MNENNENLVNPTLAEVRSELLGQQAQDTATLLNRIDQLEKDLAKAEAGRDAMHRAYEQRGEIIDNVTRVVQREFDNGVLEADTVLFDDLCLYLEIEQTEETEIEIVVRWNCTVTHKKGEFDASNIEASVDEPDLTTYGDDYEFGWVSHYETEVNEA